LLSVIGRTQRALLVCGSKVLFSFAGHFCPLREK